MHGQWWFIIIYPLVISQFAMENPPFSMGKSTINGPFSIAMLVCRRVSRFLFVWISLEYPYDIPQNQQQGAHELGQQDVVCLRVDSALDLGSGTCEGGHRSGIHEILYNMYIYIYSTYLVSFKQPKQHVPKTNHMGGTTNHSQRRGLLLALHYIVVFWSTILWQQPSA